jgi:serine/threonine protein kinase
VKVYDHGEVREGGYLYLVMDYVDGPSLGKLSRDGIDRRLGVTLVADTARALAFAHEREVLHRDMKPDNVLVTLHDHRIHLTDFGLAKVKDSAITGTGDVMGTPNYVPPEQLEDSKRATPQADVYGLGGILYAVLTRRPPFEGRAIGDILRKVALGRLHPPEDYVPDLEPELSRICRKALSLTPSQRQVSPAAFAEELEAWLAKQGA